LEEIRERLAHCSCPADGGRSVIPLCAGCWKMLTVADTPRCLDYPKGIPERFWSGEVRCKEFEMKRIGPF